MSFTYRFCLVWRQIALLFCDFIRNELFSHKKYVRNLISRGVLETKTGDQVHLQLQSLVLLLQRLS